ncbi:MAG: alpha/beta hydrolase [Geminicoccaceae bacterium]
MKRMSASITIVLCILLQAAGQAFADGYDYAIDDALAATVVGTPPDQAANFDMPAPIKEKTLSVFPKKTYPDVFWYTEQLRYGLALQRHSAPLAFIIAGTGADHNTTKMILLANALYQAGAHVVTLPSPTHNNFIISASMHAVAGRNSDDVQDLYRVMQLISDQIGDRAEIDGYYLTGYSMGGFHAAFLAAHDAEAGAFGFDRVLMLNPPVSLFESALKLDAMLAEAIPGDLETFDTFFDDFMRDLADFYVRADNVELTGDDLYRLYEAREGETDPNRLKALIGLAFRLSGINMLFAADVMNDFGYIVPKGSQLGVTSGLTEYFKVGARIKFEEYIEDVLIPLVKARDPDATRSALIDEANLRSIEGFMRATPTISLIHNVDDIILKEGDIAWFEDVFGGRSKIYPNGGHLGNVYHRAVVDRIVEYFRTATGAGS